MHLVYPIKSIAIRSLNWRNRHVDPRFFKRPDRHTAGGAPSAAAAKALGRRNLAGRAAVQIELGGACGHGVDDELDVFVELDAQVDGAGGDVFAFHGGGE
jgi:hypothetical protein